MQSQSGMRQALNYLIYEARLICIIIIYTEQYCHMNSTKEC